MRFFHLAVHETHGCTEHRFMWYFPWLHLHIVISWYQYNKAVRG